MGQLGGCAGTDRDGKRIEIPDFRSPVAEPLEGTGTFPYRRRDEQGGRGYGNSDESADDDLAGLCNPGHTAAGGFCFLLLAGCATGLAGGRDSAFFPAGKPAVHEAYVWLCKPDQEDGQPDTGGDSGKSAAAECGTGFGNRQETAS